MKIVSEFAKINLSLFENLIIAKKLEKRCLFHQQRMQFLGHVLQYLVEKKAEKSIFGT